jgi:protocatechuate 3,4-dioxygenase beta subunit
MNTFSTLRRPKIEFLFFLGLSFTQFVIGQSITVSSETFPNTFNSSFGTTNNSNGTFTGSIGTWTGSSNTNAAVAVIPAYYSPVTNAIKIVNWNTTGKSFGECAAASPTVNLSSYNCTSAMNLQFKLYTYACNSADVNTFLHLEYTTNGSTWTSVYSKSSAQIFNTWGASAITTITVPIDQSYRVSTFKYRFRGYKPAGQGNDFYVFIDDVKISADACASTGSIGDRVWFDADGDGIQDASETTGIAGITVQLKNSAGTIIATTTTNSTGNYLFSGLAAGTYKVVFPASISGAIVTGQNVGSNDDIDSDASQSTGETGNIVLATGQNITNVDAGYCPTTLVLGNRVWNDANNTGINDGETGISGVTVNLYKDDNNDNIADGPSIASTSTDVDGYYTFNNLGPGNYIIGVVTPAGFLSSAVNGGDPDNDINLDDNGQITVGNETRGLAITLIAGTEPTGSGNENITYDFGFFVTNTASIGDFVWNDLNGNGVQDAGEPGIPGVTVTLSNGATTTTNASGAYSFTNLPAGNYTVTFSTPAGYTSAPSNAGGDDTKDSDPVNGVVSVTLAAGQNNTTIDAGYYRPASLGDFVWNDANGNGVQDAGEPGISGVVVTLTGTTGSGVAVNASTTTNASGAYSFTNLAPGTYSVSFATPSGYAPSPSNAGGDDTKDSDPVNGVVSVILAAGQNNTTIDAGFYRPASLGDFVWNDVNGNGVQDAGEAGISGATVTLIGTTGSGAAVNASTTTNASGAYSFNNLAPGTYNVSFATPSGYAPSPSNAGGDDTKDSDPVNGTASGIVLTSGQNNPTVDAGFIQNQNIFITGNVFYDGNGMGDNLVNGTYQIPSGINAVLYNPLTNTVLAVQPVPGSGQPGQGTFSFNALFNTTYRVMITTANPAVGTQAPATSLLPTSFISTGEIIGTGSGNDGTVDGKSAIFTTSNVNVANVNFAIKRFNIIVVD